AARHDGRGGVTLPSPMPHWTLTTLTLIGLAALVVAVFAGWAHLRFWTRRLTLSLEYTSSAQLTTPDGATIELRRVPIPSAAPKVDLPPVLLVHGLGANHRNQDLHPDFSLARYLAARGRDVWLLTLRSGLRPRRWAERQRVRFGAMVENDLPVAVNGVLEQTGASALDYVGFSMGGMLLYAAIGRSVPEAQIRRAVIVGSPGRVGVARWMRPLLRLVPRALVPTMRFRLASAGIAFASEWLKTPFHSFTINPGNVAKGITRAAMINLIEDIPGPLYADFIEWAAADGEIRTTRGAALAGLVGVGVPALFMAGTADKLAPIPSVRRAFDAWGKDLPETSKRFVSVGRAFGHAQDYGHGDLAIGTQVAADLFAPIASFLEEDLAAVADAAGTGTG
ncbi:MAG: alpha/beta fold hydrolase, partial [Byssovorax sp.]